MIYFIQNKSTNYAGFALLYAVIVSSILLSVSLIILNLSLKGAQLTSISSESQFAIYAADAGAECALYWDLVHNSFNPMGAVTSIQCADAPAVFVGGFGSYPSTDTFTIDFSSAPSIPNNYCVIVTVTKNDSPVSTDIEAHGFNTCDVTSNRRVERTFLISY